MEHVEEHPHAFVLNNKVIWAGVFSAHDEPILEILKAQFGADEVVCCCNVGYAANVNDTWDGVNFTPEPKEPSQEYLDWLANNPE